MISFFQISPGARIPKLLQVFVSGGVALLASGLASDLMANLPLTPPPPPPGGFPQTPPPPPENLPDPAELLSQLHQLDELLQLSPEKLERLAQTIAYVRKMDDAEREAMRIRLRQVTQMTPELRTEINRLAALLPVNQRTNVSQFWLAAASDERDALRVQWRQLDEGAFVKLLQDQVTAFVARRDAAFDGMRQRLQQTPQVEPGQ